MVLNRGLRTIADVFHPHSYRLVSGYAMASPTLKFPGCLTFPAWSLYISTCTPLRVCRRFLLRNQTSTRSPECLFAVFFARQSTGATRSENSLASGRSKSTQFAFSVCPQYTLQLFLQSPCSAVHLVGGKVEPCGHLADSDTVHKAQGGNLPVRG